MPRQLLTQTGKLSDIARHVVVPSGVVTTGWPAVRDTCSGFGVEFDPWQDGAGRLIMSKRADGSYAATVGGVVLSIPRQVGKTFLIGAIVFALCLLFPGLTVIWTAHRLRTASETFLKMQAFAQRRKINPHIAKIVLGSGDEEVGFTNGSRILFGARERGFGRGWDDVDVVVFDEGQILSENAIDDMVPATNVAANPLVIFMGTPPKEGDPSEVFTRKRADALSGEDEDTVYIEFSADQDAEPTDRKQWAKANPSYPRRTNDASVLRMLKNLSDESFLREALGIWAATDSGVFPPGSWAECMSTESDVKGVPWFAIDVAEDRSWAAIAAAGKSTADSSMIHASIVDYRPGTGWVAARAAQLRKKHGGRFVIAASSPAISLLSDLKEARVPCIEVTTEEQAKACGKVYDLIVDRRFRHRGDRPELDYAVRHAVKRTFGDAWLFTRRKSSVDISPLVAVVLAADAAYRAKKKATVIDLNAVNLEAAHSEV